MYNTVLGGAEGTAKDGSSATAGQVSFHMADDDDDSSVHQAPDEHSEENKKNLFLYEVIPVLYRFLRHYEGWCTSCQIGAYPLLMCYTDIL